MIKENKQRLAVTLDRKTHAVLEKLQKLHTTQHNSKSEIIEVAIIHYAAAIMELYSNTKGENKDE